MDLQLFFDNFDVIAAAPNGVKKLRELILQLAVRGGLSDSRKNNLFKTGKVSDFVKVLNGYAFKSEWFLQQGVRLFRNANVGHGNLNWKDVAKISKQQAIEFQRYNLAEGDIVISLDRPIIATGLKIANIARE